MKFSKFLVVVILFVSSVAHAFTYTDTWSIPNDQKCDNWNSVSKYTAAYLPVIQSGESRKIIIPVPYGSKTGYISFKSHASEPSKLITEVNYLNAFYIKPRLGSHVSQAFSNPKNYLYVYHNAISNDANLGPSTMADFTASFKLTDAECSKRGGIEPPKVIVPDLEVKPIILREDFSFNLNQLQLKSDIFAIQFEYVKVLNNQYYFKTTSIRPVTEGEDYDKDSYTIVSGDCNDNDPNINPNKGNCN